jgi:hypothetical protein
VIRMLWIDEARRLTTVRTHVQQARREGTRSLHQVSGRATGAPP